ncbi:MAG: 3-deoxy-manno-octulosonate cytidylyltransferase [Thiotrichales bacterium]|jgi:3-deoxy-manno-octulosonate cytidylyltransferase (CMP-KDO synthetase)|nr:3-deoxy-manno-octulosonate cytidylyltransferase [Thiotrichales bacterium]MBT3613030.1 3-deoxy-manno-octulosonate cytidylyltransferase [Thiotrichales bacterium]MBT3751932.1 3-deoxy-manno-octulosonate cytidylyltransferase [Thiotrichales bacterium]MBT3836752.1 3-deoxy-manno-octulosonate cytidylyltransferase [Thiotrichales bacterium]MBT4151726.1 3-deoxy-manno-octulosonate cytidylyltransferase [Thiotrichales bacterium]
MSFTVIIPARYDSTRLPGKPLLEIDGRPMVSLVWERAQQSGANRVIVATDDNRIADAIKDISGEVCMTRSDHQSGTDRLAEVASKLNFADDEIVVNLQGDEPQMPATLIKQVAEDMEKHPDAAVTTLYQGIDREEDISNSNAVKVVLDELGYALYFSRAPIPWDRDRFLSAERPVSKLHNRHIGLYAYRSSFLHRYSNWSPSPLEQIESLEQLRVLWKGERIHLTEATEDPGHGIDTLEDLEQLRANSGKILPA